MHLPKDELPILLEVPGATLRGAQWGDMSVAYAQLAKGTDFTPVLKGLKDELCPCSHWGYVLKGALHVRYADGREEVVRAGDLWHATPLHTVWCEEDTEYVDFSPPKEFDQVVDHIRRLVGA